MTNIREHPPVFNMTEATAWVGRWWLLDVETSGLDPREDDIIALRLACMEDYEIMRERKFLVRPCRPLSPWAEKLTGISNRDLEGGIFPQKAVGLLEALDGPLLLLDRGFALPFLQAAALRCGRAFSHPCLLLDRLSAGLLGGSPRQRTERFLEKLPRASGGMPPHDPDLKKLYQLSLAVFHALAETYHIQDSAQLDFYAAGGGMEAFYG